MERLRTIYSLRRSVSNKSGMTHKPWDQKEPIIDALARCGLLDAFNAVIAEEKREEALLVLRNVGVDDDTADRLVRSLLGS